MNRRNFLKRCSLLPFVGSLAAVGKAGASEDKVSTELGESRSFIYQGYYFTVQDMYDSELKYVALHPFFAIQGIFPMILLNDQFDDLQKRYIILDEMIRQWKKKQIYTIEELRGF